MRLAVSDIKSKMLHQMLQNNLNNKAFVTKHT